MTTDNTQELEKEVALLVANLAHEHMMTLQATGRADFTPFNRAILDWHNKQVEEVLDRLASLTHEGRGTIAWEMDNMASAIEAERKKKAGV